MAATIFVDVIGPDEYHETVDDNAYTNGLAQWNLEVGEEVTRLVAQRWPEQWRALSRRLGLEAEEPRRWLQVARELYTGFDERTGLFEQFRGYFGLEDIDLAAFAGAHRADGRAARRASAFRRSQIIKQADVVMLLHLLWERLPAGGAQGELRVLRATLRAWQLAEPGNSRARGGSPWRCRAGGALLPASSRDRFVGQHGERGWRRSCRSSRRTVAGGGVRLCRLALHRRGARASAQPAAKLAQPVDAISVAGPMA